MLRNILNSTSKIHQKLKAASETITIHADGITMDGVGSMRLSNIPGNLQCNLITSLKILLLLVYYADATRYAYRHRLSSPDNKNQYEIFDGIGCDDGIGCIDYVRASLEDCGTIPSDRDYFAGEHVYWMSSPAGNTILDRAAGESINEEIENCLTNLINSQVHDYLYKSQDKFQVIKLIVMMIYLVMMIGLFFGGERLLNNRRNQQFFHSSSKHSNFSKPLTLDERLDQINFDGDIPHRFRCPITKLIMTYPCLTDDGHHYERKELEYLKNANLPCPQNPHLYVNTIMTDIDLRSDILEFVEKQEHLYKTKQSALAKLG